MYLYYDILTLDSDFQNKFAAMIRSGRALNIVYSSCLMHTQAVLSKDFTCQVLRNLARVKSIFIAFTTAAGNHSNEPQSNEFFHPPQALENGDSNIEYFMTLGGKKLVTFPVGPQAAAEMFYRLKCAAGNHDFYLSPIRDHQYLR